MNTIPSDGQLYLIDSIRPVLGLEAETRVLAIDCSTLARQCAIQEVACVKLDPGLGGVHFQYPPASSMMDPGDKPSHIYIGPGQKSRQGQVNTGSSFAIIRPSHRAGTRYMEETKLGRASREILVAS